MKKFRFISQRFYKHTVERLWTMPLGTQVEWLSYDLANRVPFLDGIPTAFVDMDRLGKIELAEATRVYHQLKGAGVPVFNNPTKVLTRLSLLKELAQRGYNDYDAYHYGDWDKVTAFPVFVREGSGHEGPLSGLLNSKEELKEKLDDLAAKPEVRTDDLIIIQYCAEEYREGIFKKYSVYRIGDLMVPSTPVTEDNWTVKYGPEGPLCNEDDFELIVEEIKEKKFVEEMREVFDIANITYGRIDFSLVNGRPQIYEINTNPMLTFELKHRSKVYQGGIRIARDAFLSALEANSAKSIGKVYVGEECRRGRVSIHGWRHQLVYNCKRAFANK